MRIVLPAPVETPMLRDHLTDAPEDLGGGHGGTVTADLSMTLARMGHDVTVVTLDDGISQVQHASGPNLRYIGLPMRSDGRGYDLWLMERRQLTRTIAELDADIINAHWTFEYSDACLDETRPLVVTAHDWPPLVLRHHLKPFWIPRLALAARVMAARPPTTTPSPSIAIRYHRYLRQDVALTTNGVPREMVVTSSRPVPDAHVVVSVANGFDSRKNTSMLLQAWPQVRASVDGTLRMFGFQHGPGEAAQRWAGKRGLDTGGVEFIGMVPRERVLEEMAQAAVLAHPAAEEPFGMVVIEAMAKGTPVVAVSGSGGPPHILEHGRYGAIVPRRASEAMAGELIRLMRDEALWSRQSDEGRQRVLDEFTIDVAAERYVAVYERLLSGRAVVG